MEKMEMGVGLSGEEVGGKGKWMVKEECEMESGGLVGNEEGVLWERREEGKGGSG